VLTAGLLPPQVARGQPAQLGVDDRQKFFQSAAVAATPLFELYGDTRPRSTD
jgi:hypothetical protein